MTLPVGGISLTIETSGVKRGKDEFKQATQEMKASAQAAERSIEELRAEAKLLEEGLRQMKVPAEAIAAQMQKMERAALTAAGPQGVGATTVVVDKAAKTATAASPAFNKAAGSLQALALAAAGIPGPVGRVASSLGALSIGSGPAALAVAGMAAVVAALVAIDAPARKAREEMAAVAESYKKMIADIQGANADFLTKEILALGDEAAGLVRKVADARAKIDSLRGPAGAGDVAAQGQIRLLLTQVDALNTKIGSVNQEISLTGQRLGEVTIAGIKAGEKTLEAARAAAEERRQSLAVLAQLELEVALANARNINEERQARRTLSDFQIDAQVRALKGLTDLERARAKQRLEEKRALDEQEQAQKDLLALEKQRLDQFKTFIAENRALLDALRSDAPKTFRGAVTLVDTPSNAGPFDAAQILREARERADAERQVRDAQKAATLSAVDLAGAILGLDQAAISGVRGIVDIVASINEIKKFNATTGAGASLLSQLPTLLGGVVEVVSLAGSLLDSDQARRIAIAKVEFEDSLRAFQDIGREVSGLEASLRSLTDSLGEAAVKALGVGGFVGGTPLDVDTPEEIRATIAELRRIAATTKALREEANAAIAALEKLLAANEENRRRLEEQARQEIGRFQEDLAVRRLVAEGRDEEANALRRSLEVQREILDLRKRFGDLFTEEIEEEIRRIRAIEEETAAVRAANEEAQRRADIAQSLTLRELNARAALGENVAAEIRAAEQQAEIEAAIRQGYTESEIARLRYIHGLEDEAVALAELNAAIEEALRIFEFNRDLEEDLRLRFLRATNDPGADDYEREVRNRREIDRLIAEGASQANIEFARMVQSLEAVSDALAEASKAAEEAARLAKEQAEAQADLNVRDLRSRGLGDAADDVAFFDRQRRERQDAIDRGYGPDYLADLDRVQRQEREQREAERRAGQQEEFDRQFSITAPSFVGDSNATVSLGVGVSGSQIDRLSGVSQSMFTLQARYLPRLDLLISIDRRLAIIAGQPDASTQLQDDITTSERAIGLNPSNN